MNKPYFQSSDFTCGPASLMMVMQKLSPERVFDPLEEFLIWREANSIFMGHRHAGCTQYGLARAALRRGFKVEIYSNNISNFDKHFEECVLSGREKDIFNLVHHHDKVKAKEEGALFKKEAFSLPLFDKLLKQGKGLILLMRSLDDNEEHWVKVTKIGSKTVSILDPFKNNLKDRQAISPPQGATHRLDHERFERRCRFGAKKDYLLLAVG